jgi:hypothetical protein
MSNLIWTVVGGCLAAIPSTIAYRRKCANHVLIYLFSLFLSWTIIGWFVAMGCAMWGRSDPT